MLGWTFRDGLWLNTGVEGDPHVQERRAFVAFDPSSLAVHVLPWADASGDYLRFSPELPFGTTVGTPFEIEAGWEYPCTGTLSRLQVVDLQLTNWSSYLRTFGAEGVKVIWWMAAGLVADSGGGYWRPKRSRVTGAPFSANPQTDDRATGSIQDDWVPGSLAYYGAEGKQNNALYHDGSINRAYHTGKIWHAPAPLAVFWAADGRYLGKVVGRLEWDAENSQEVKAYPLAECMAYVNAGAVEVSIDATLGYTTSGASSDTLQTGQGRTWASSFSPAASEDGAVSSVSVAYSSKQAGNLSSYFYSGAVRNGATRAGSSTNLAETVGYTVSGPWITANLSGSLVNGTQYWFGVGNYDVNFGIGIKYDADASYNYVLYTSGYDNPPATAGAPAATRSSRRSSGYLTYTTGAPGGFSLIATDMDSGASPISLELD